MNKNMTIRIYIYFLWLVFSLIVGQKVAVAEDVYYTDFRSDNYYLSDQALNVELLTKVKENNKNNFFVRPVADFGSGFIYNSVLHDWVSFTSPDHLLPNLYDHFKVRLVCSRSSKCGLSFSLINKSSKKEFKGRSKNFYTLEFLKNYASSLKLPDKDATITK